VVIVAVLVLQFAEIGIEVNMNRNVNYEILNLKVISQVFILRRL